jgi:hypothetical protein
MSTLRLRLSNSLHEEVKKLAHLEKRARHGSKRKFSRALRKVRGGPPAEEDRLG